METVQHKKKKEQVIDFSRLWAALVRRKTTYFKVIPTVILTVWVITLGLPDYYKCKIQLVPESSSGGGSNTLALLASSFGVNLGSGSSGNDAITAFLYPDVMSSVEFKAELFKVKVVKVNTMNVRGKQRRQRTAAAGWTSNWKKAIVTLKQGDKIILT